jgi:lipoprotein-anchoring transpeptidase ErfK/SrfK
MLAGLIACRMDPTGGSDRGHREGGPTTHAVAVPSASHAHDDSLSARDLAPGAPLDPVVAEDQPRPLMQLQVVLDRLGFTPGVVDGQQGLSTRNAVAGFQESKGLSINGELDAPTRRALATWSEIPATRIITIPADFAAGPFQKIPVRPEDQAKLPSLGYQSLDEKLAERFHTTLATLLKLNPDTAQSTSASDTPQSTDALRASHFHADQQIRVPNVGADRIEENVIADARWRDTLAMLGVSSNQPQATKIVVSKSKETLKAYDGVGQLIGMYTATMGSSHDPLPLGQWRIVGIARNPDFSFNPDLLWDVPNSETKQRLPPGPNGPVGVVWIKLNKPHYGIHGTPEPMTIGRTQSHGCVRLTNWDAARLAQMVKAGTQVSFEA